MPANSSGFNGVYNVVFLIVLFWFSSWFLFWSPYAYFALYFPCFILIGLFWCMCCCSWVNFVPVNKDLMARLCDAMFSKVMFAWERKRGGGCVASDIYYSLLVALLCKHFSCSLSLASTFLALSRKHFSPLKPKLTLTLLHPEDAHSYFFLSTLARLKLFIRFKLYMEYKLRLMRHELDE